MPNHLDQEVSPYLRQHRLNPVNWFPWGEEAFERAKVEDKPVFLSIGYATCHWCHVMEHESFEDREVAALMNEAFICVKVDREERPDIDQVYMTYCQLSTGQGGWPLTIIMTPEGQPFFSATYLPKQSRFGRVGMMDLVPRVAQLWKQQKEDVLASAAQNVQALSGAGAWDISDEGPAAGVLDFAFQQLEDRYDPEYAGFGEAPKFPSPHQLQFLVRYAHSTGNQKALKMAGNTIKKMRMGGIFDHVGFGFHRYATDRKWLLPHFEKMLYDQAMIALAAIDLFQATGEEAYKEIAEKIFEYVLRDMTDKAGGFYSAEDADSEGVEGKFYVWTLDEINKHLDDHTAALFSEVYAIKAAGNFKEEATGELTGHNIPHLRQPLSLDVDIKVLESAREILFNVRKRRIHPEKDDKILTDWNGLMIAALGRAAQVLDNNRYLQAGIQAARFVLVHLTRKDGRLFHRFRLGITGIQANLDDYAFMVYGLLNLYEATFDISYLQEALRLNQLMLLHFWDEEKGGLFFTPDDGEVLITRQKEAYDGAVPSGNSVALLNLLRIGRITGDVVYDERANELLRMFGLPINNHPVGFCAMLAGVDFAHGSSIEIVVVGDPGEEGTIALIREIQGTYLPNKIVLLKDGKNHEALAAIAPFTEGMKALNGLATVYVCENYKCNQPVTDISSLRALISANRDVSESF